MNITNFRDIGGYETADGRRVKRGCFYRSGPIVFRSDADRTEFEALGMKTILDLRSSQERQAAPDDEAAGTAYIPCGAIPEETATGGNFDLAELMRSGGDLSVLTEYVAAIYRGLPFQNPAYQVLFDLLRKDGTPLVFHCSAGKDRTGFAAYLILKTLGVPDETILEDYLLSNVYRREENERVLARFPRAAEAEGLLYVKAEYLQSAMDAIAERYPDFRAYLAAEYSVTDADIAAFRERYLENC